MTIREMTKLRNGKELDIQYPIILKDKDGNEVYFEASDGYLAKREYADGKVVCYETSDCWLKREYVAGKEVYYEDSDGYIIDNRVKAKDMTVAEIEAELGYKVKVVKGARCL